ncbi:hypothetical protein Tco_1046917 [Tanacetum coccineum]
MGDENHIRTLGDYSKPSHEGYKNTIELPVENNVVPLRSDTVRRTIDQSVGGKLRDRNAEESWALLEDLSLYDNESWNDPRDFTKPDKAITLPQDVPSTSDRHLIELENQVQRLILAQSSDTEFICIKGGDGEVMFIELIRKNDDSSEGEPEEEGSTTTEGVGAEYFYIFPTRSELAYHKADKVAYKMPHKIEQYNSLSYLEKKHTKSVYLRNKEDKRRGVEYVMSKILGFYKECLELGLEYVTGMDDEGEVT